MEVKEEENVEGGESRNINPIHGKRSLANPVRRAEKKMFEHASYRTSFGYCIPCGPTTVESYERIIQ